MADANTAIDWMLKHEGGLVDNPNDKGGLTNYGISQRAYPSVDVRNLTRDQAVKIYLSDYWEEPFNRISDQTIANKMLDMKVNFGSQQAVSLIQRALRQFGWAVAIDGKFGPQTLDFLNRSNPEDLIVELRTQSVLYYVGIVESKPNQAVFLKGWIRRACA